MCLTGRFSFTHARIFLWLMGRYSLWMSSIVKNFLSVSVFIFILLYWTFNYLLVKEGCLKRKTERWKYVKNTWENTQKTLVYQGILPKSGIFWKAYQKPKSAVLGKCSRYMWWRWHHLPEEVLWAEKSVVITNCKKSAEIIVENR